MSSVNKVILIGHAGDAPKIRDLGQTKSANLSLATSESFTNRNGERVETTEWHNVQLWGKLADVAEKYIRKGTQLYIEGRLRTRSWEDQQGQKHYTTEIVVDNLQLLGKKADNPAVANGGYQAPTQPAQPAYQQSAQSVKPAPAATNFEAEGPEDDLPF